MYIIQLTRLSLNFENMFSALTIFFTLIEPFYPSKPFVQSISLKRKIIIVLFHASFKMFRSKKLWIMFKNEIPYYNYCSFGAYCFTQSEKNIACCLCFVYNPTRVENFIPYVRWMSLLMLPCKSSNLGKTVIKNTS